MTSRNQVQDLRPGTNYQIQVRAVSGGLYSDWSRVFDFTTIKDEMPPEDVQNVTWVSSGDSFHAEWDPITQNINLEDIIIDHYDLELTNPGNVKMIVTVPQGSSRLSYDLSFEANRALWGTPQATVSLRVRAVDNKGLYGNWTVPISATNAPPSPVTNLNVTAVTDGIYLKWTAPADTDLAGYNLYVGAASNPTARLNSKPITTTEYNYATLTYSLQYFKVTVIDKFGQESTGVEVSAKPNSPFTADTTAPATPTALAATITNNTNGIGARAAVSWTMSSPPSDLAGFYIHYRRVGDTIYSTATFTNADRAGTINLDSAYTDYEFQIKAFDWSNNESAWSITTWSISPAPTTPPQITGVVSTPSEGSILYSWTPSTDKSVVDYQVDIATNSGFSTGLLTFHNGTSSTLTINGLSSSTTYYMRVRAINAGGVNGTYSTTDTETTPQSSNLTTVSADIITPGTLGTAGGGIINIGSGATLQTNGGAIKSNTFNGTFTSGVYNNNATAGFYIDSTNGIIVKTGKVSADALVAGTISGTNTITLSGANAKIVGGTWSLSGSGLSIPNGGIQAAALNISGSAVNMVPGEFGSFELNPSFYGTDVSSYPESGTFLNTYLSNVATYGNVAWPQGWMKGEGVSGAILTTEPLAGNPSGNNAIAIPPGANMFPDPYLRDAVWSAGGGAVTNLPESLNLPWDAAAWVCNQRDHIVQNHPMTISPGATYYVFAKLKRLSGTLDMYASFWYGDGTPWDNNATTSTKLKAVGPVNEDGWYLAMASIVVPASHSAASSLYLFINQPGDGTGSTSFLATDLSYFHVGSGSNAMAKSLNFPVVAGDSYTVTFKAYAPAGTGTHFFRIQNDSTSNYYDFEANVSNSGMTSWKDYSFTWVAPTDYTWPNFRFYNYGSSTGFLYISDVSIVNDTTGEFTTNNIDVVSPSSPNNAGWAVISPDNFMNGKQSLKVTLTSTASGGYVEVHGKAPNIPVEPNETYIVSAYVYQEGGAGNDSWIRMQMQGAGSGSPGITSSNINISAINTWQRVSWTFTTGSTQTKVKLYPVIGANSPVSNRVYYVDGIMLEQQLSNSTTPSTYTSGGYTQVSGDMIITGAIHSTAKALDADGSAVANSWAWSLDTQGNATLGNTQVNGSMVVGNTAAGTNSIIQSAGFTPASNDSNGNLDPSSGNGWRINSDGSAEFYSVKALNLEANALSVKSISPLAIGDGEFGAVVNLTGGIEIDSTDSNGNTVQRLGMSAARGFYSERINGDGSITPYILFPVNGAPNIISGQLYTDDFSIGEANELGTGKVNGTLSIMSGSILSLNNVVEAPAAPVVTQTWDYKQTSNYANGFIDSNGRQAQYISLTYVDANTYAAFYKINYSVSSGWYNVSVRPIPGQAYPVQFNDTNQVTYYGIALLNASDLSLRNGTVTASVHSLGNYSLQSERDTRWSDGSVTSQYYSNYTMFVQGITYSPSNGYVLCYGFGNGSNNYIEAYNSSFNRTSQVILGNNNSTDFFNGQGLGNPYNGMTTAVSGQYSGSLNDVIISASVSLSGSTHLRVARVNFSSAGVINSSTPLINMAWTTGQTSGGWTSILNVPFWSGIVSAGTFDLGRDGLVMFSGTNDAYYYVIDATTGVILSSKTAGGTGAQGWSTGFNESTIGTIWDKNLSKFVSISYNGKLVKYQNGSAYSKTAVEGDTLKVNVTYSRTVSISGTNYTYETTPSSPGTVPWHNRGLYTVTIQQVPYNAGDPNSPDRANVYAWGAIASTVGPKLLSTIIQPGNNLVWGSTNFALIDDPHPLTFPGSSVSKITGANGLIITSAGDVSTNRLFPQQWVGSVQMFAGNTPPDGWMVCDGRSLSQSTYSLLFNALGGASSPWGVSGTSTFNIPNLKGRVVVGVGQASATGATNHTLGQVGGEETHTLSVTEMPSHNHGGNGGGFYISTSPANLASGSATGRTVVSTTANTGGSGAHNIMQPYAGMNYIIYTGVHA